MGVSFSTQVEHTRPRTERNYEANAEKVCTDHRLFRRPPNAALSEVNHWPQMARRRLSILKRGRFVASKCY
jgi:hypothetical protein